MCVARKRSLKRRKQPLVCGVFCLADSLCPFVTGWAWSLGAAERVGPEVAPLGGDAQAAGPPRAVSSGLGDHTRSWKPCISAQVLPLQPHTTATVTVAESPRMVDRSSGRGCFGCSGTREAVSVTYYSFLAIFSFSCKAVALLTEPGPLSVTPCA